MLYVPTGTELGLNVIRTAISDSQSPCTEKDAPLGSPNGVRIMVNLSKQGDHEVVSPLSRAATVRVTSVEEPL